jgi:hypothetical protein
MIFVVIVLLAGTQYWFKERQNPNLVVSQSSSSTALGPTVPSVQPGTGQILVGSFSSFSSAAAITGTGSGMNPIVVKKGISLKKYSGPAVETILAALQLVPVQTSEASLLKLSAGQDALKVNTVVLLRNNDRAALFSWLESDDVKTLFSALKQALQEQFSPQVKDLIDETRTQENGPPLDYLSFTDPAISPEKVVFIRVRTRLYEFHIAAGQEDTINRLITELDK